MKDIIENKLYKDKNGIWVQKQHNSIDKQISKEAWERIYNFDLNQLEDDLQTVAESKLADHIKYISKFYKFSEKTYYLEIGCGPAHVGNYLIDNYDINFIGIDFNYKLLLSLKEYFDKKGFKKYTLICDDINNMPIKDNTIDFIYGGGVIEHFSNTQKIVNESYRVLSNNGVLFNTIPSFNLSWLIRFYRNIPDVIFLKDIFEFFHIKVFKGEILKKYFGYELSYTRNKIKKIYEKSGFKNIEIGNFIFNPDKNFKINKYLLKVLIKLMNINFLSPIIFIAGKKT